MKDKRFSTYSASLASRLCIKEGSYSFNDADKISTFNPNEKYIYGDFLPKLAVNFYSIDNTAKIESWYAQHDYHVPGASKGIKIRYIIKKVSGSKNDKQYEIELIILWKFIVERPMSIGDKFTVTRKKAPTSISGR